MSSWFSFWGEDHETDSSNLDATLDSTVKIRDSVAKTQIAKGALGAVEGLTGLMNISLYKKERDNAIKAIENTVLAGQDQIIRDLSYNTDQALVYAARGNVSIGSPVMLSRMKKGAEEAGYDFAMLRANADIAKTNVNIKYAQKRRQAVNNAIKGISGALLSYGVYKYDISGSLNEAVYGE